MTTQTTQVTAIYEPDRDSITFEHNGKVSHGFVGQLAIPKLMEAYQKGIPVTIRTKDEKDKDMEKTSLIKQFHAILAKKGMMNIKEDILDSYHVASTKDLTIEQLEQTINQLNNAPTPEQIRKARSMVLSLLDKLDVKGNSEIGWNHVNSYLMQPRIAGKQLYQMSLKELNDCGMRLRAIISKQTIKQ